MRHLETQHHLGHLAAGERGADGLCHLLGKHLEIGQFGVVHIKDVIDLLAGYHQCVTLGERTDVEECVEVGTLGTLVARYLAGCNLRENGSHNRNVGLG